MEVVMDIWTDVFINTRMDVNTASTYWNPHWVPWMEEKLHHHSPWLEALAWHCSSHRWTPLAPNINVEGLCGWSVAGQMSS